MTYICNTLVCVCVCVSRTMISIYLRFNANYFSCKKGRPTFNKNFPKKINQAAAANSSQTKPSPRLVELAQTKPKQAKPSQVNPDQARPDQTRPGQTKPTNNNKVNDSHGISCWPFSKCVCQSVGAQRRLPAPSSDSDSVSVSPSPSPTATSTPSSDSSSDCNSNSNSPDFNCLAAF